MRKWKLKRDWALLTAHSWQVTEPDSSLSPLLLKLMLFPLLHWPTFFFFFLSYTWFYLRNSRFSLFLTQRNLSQDNAHQPSLELFHFHKQLESYYLWREQSLSFNQCLLSAFGVAHTVLETGDVAVNTNKTFSFLLFSRCCGAEGELDKKINKKVSTLSSEKCYAEFCIKQSSIYRT